MSKEDTDKEQLLLEGPLHRWLKACLPEQLSSSESGIADGLDKLIAPIGDSSDKSTWQPSDDDKQVAWLIYTELRSRVTTQDLPYSDGQDAAALESVYTLFKTTRDAVNKQGLNCQIVAHVAFCMLNKVVRPFTAKWHLRNVSGKLVNNDERNEFRRELEALKIKLRRFEICFARMTGQMGGIDRSQPQIKLLDGLDPLDLGLRQEMASLSVDMRNAEVEVIKNRRTVFERPGTYENLNGLAISGGGIRSATFALGVCDRLASTGMFKQFDYLSSVSGGAYLGSLITSRLVHKTENDIQDFIPFDHGRETGTGSVGNPDTADRPALGKNPVVNHLRDNGRYLLKNKGKAIALWTFGLGVNLLLIFSLALFISGFAYVVDAGIAGAPGLRSIAGWMRDSSAVVSYAGFCMLVLLFVLVPWIKHQDPAEQEIEKLSSLFLGIFVVGMLAYSAFNKGYLSLYFCTANSFYCGAWYKPYLIPPTTAFIALSVLAIAAFIGLSKPTAKILLIISSVLAAIFLLSLTLAVANTPLVIQHPIYTLLISIVLFWWLSRLDINRASFSNYYRKGLAITYLQTEPTEWYDPLLHQLMQPSEEAETPERPYLAPYHLIGAALNIPSSTSYRVNERNADFFLFSPKFCGSKAIGYHASDKPPFNKLRKSTAMVVSGAAVSPLAGRNTAYGLTPWLALLNVRLGLWFSNPLQAEKNPMATPFLLWRELLGCAGEESSHINVSDGGHIENLGVYELLRRRCQTIICIDGEADPKMEYDGLLRLIQLAKVDLDVDIEIDLDSLKPRENGFSYSHFAMAKITYPLAEKHSTEKCNNVGYMLYIKSSLTGNEQPYILDYKRKQPDFPHQSTSDQFFSEEQFESYRALGYHVAEDLLTDLNLNGELYSPADNTHIDIKTMMQRLGGMQLLFTHLRKKLHDD